MAYNLPLRVLSKSISRKETFRKAELNQPFDENRPKEFIPK